MKSVEVLEHPTLGVKEIKVGFSWPAFYFGFIWSLVKKLWGYTLIYFVIFVALNALAIVFEAVQVGEYASPVYLLNIGLGLVWGANGNKWIRNYYVKRGFVPVGLMCGASPYRTNQPL
jgi:hypothetical protein